jgi:hypothetical protein
VFDNLKVDQPTDMAEYADEALGLVEAAEERRDE